MSRATSHRHPPARRAASPEVPLVRDVLRSPGRPLDAATRAFMEPRFGHDFSQVRVHADAGAAESARALDAMAYTVGHDAVFGSGAYAPGTPSGRRLLAHELAHIVQHGGSAAAGATRIAAPADPAERDADRAAADAMAGRDVRVATSADAGTLHRQPLPGTMPRPARRLSGSELLDGFPLGSSTLSQDHKRRIAILAVTLLDLLRDYPGSGVRVTGHTDATGGDAFNERLGQQRADAVSDALIEAGVPAQALLPMSAGESALRVPTARANRHNRRVTIRFEPASRARTPVAAEPPATEPAEEETPQEPVLVASDPGTAFDCSSNIDCAAAGTSFDRQPAGLRLLIPFDDPAGWFESLDPDSSMAVRSIYNRMCKYRLLCHVRSILYVVPGETPAKLLDLQFKVPGATPSVFFMSPSGSDLLMDLLSSGRFCLAHGAGALAHGGQTTLREISGSDSLHISIGPGDQFDAHIDLYSAAPKQTGSILCSNAPTPEAVGHIGRELVPEVVPKVLDKLTGWMKDAGPLSMVRDLLLNLSKGVQVFPEAPLTPTVPPPPPTNRQDVAPPPVVTLTWHGPAKKHHQRRQPDVPPLPPEMELLLATEVPRLIPEDALVPPSVQREVARLTHAAEMAGPDEEDALIAARDAARAQLASFPDAPTVALDMARRMNRAHLAGQSAFLLPLGPSYSGLPQDSRNHVTDQLRRTARLVRLLLDGRGGGVRKMWVLAGDVMWEVEF